MHRTVTEVGSRLILSVSEQGQRRTPGTASTADVQGTFADDTARDSSGGRRGEHKGKRIALGACAVGVVAAGGIGLFYGVRRVVEYGSNPATEPLSQPVATMIAAFGVILAAVIAFITGVLHRNVEHSKVALERDKHKHDRAEAVRRAVTDQLRDLRARYSSAAEQLGHLNPTIRQAGAHSLAALTEDWNTFENNHPQQSRKGAHMCLKLLVGYLGTRNAYPDDHPLETSRPGRWAGPDGAVRATILTLLESGLALSEGRGPWHKLDLRSADLRGVDLVERIFVHLDFSHTDLTGADLRRASFTQDMTRTTLSQSDATSASFAGTNWNAVVARGAILDFAVMHGMRIRGESDLGWTSMRRADLKHTKMLPNTGLVDADLALASVDEGTQFPTDVVRARNVSYIPLLGDTDLANFTGDDGLNDRSRKRWKLWIKLSRKRFGSMPQPEGNLTEFDWPHLAMRFSNSTSRYWSDDGLRSIDDDAAERDPGFTALLSEEHETRDPA